MCKAKPSVNNGEDITSSNTAIGLVNFSAEEWSLSKPHHRTEIVSIMIFIILIAFGLYKLRQRCLKKRNNNQQTNTAPYNMGHTPNQPPTCARDHPYNPTYHPAQPARIPLAQPMPYDIVATLNRKDSEDSTWEKSEIRPTGNPACLKMYQFILIYSILILYHFIFYTMTLGILSIILKGIPFFFILIFFSFLSNSF